MCTVCTDGIAAIFVVSWRGEWPARSPILKLYAYFYVSCVFKRNGYKKDLT